MPPARVGALPVRRPPAAGRPAAGAPLSIHGRAGRLRWGASAAGTGLLLAASLPPWGWWPLAIVAVALLDRQLEGRPLCRRAAVGFVAGLALYVLTFAWMVDFTLPGYVLAALIEAGILAAGTAAVPPDRGRRLGVVAAVTLVEAVRWVFPFGGVPLSGIALGQAGGPLLPAARVAGSLTIVAVVAALGVAVSLAADRRRRVAGVVGLGALAAVLLGVVAPDGQGSGSLRIAIVQGGGPLGTRAVDTDERVVFERHLDASAAVEGPVDLVLWPEDVVDVEGEVVDAPEGDELAALARELDTTLVAGVVEGDGDRFRNAAVAWGPDGDVVDRYEKVHRVPFGEYIPLRWLIEDVADLSLIPRDAVAGDGPGLLETPAADVGVMISWELFFSDRAASGLPEARLLLGPTNASSYRTTLVAAQEIAASRLRAVETGRWLAQAAPTGFSAVIDQRGDVLERTGQRERAVIERPVALREGRTWASYLGRWAVSLVAAAGLAAAWLRSRPGR